MIELLFGVAASILSAVAVGLLKHMVRKIDENNNRQRLTNYKMEAMVDATSQQFGNGDFRRNYDSILIQKMKEDNFIYKE